MDLYPATEFMLNLGMITLVWIIIFGFALLIFGGAYTAYDTWKHRGDN